MVNKRKIKLGNKKGGITILDRGARKDILRRQCLSEDLKKGRKEVRDTWQGLMNSREVKESSIASVE